MAHGAVLCSGNPVSQKVVAVAHELKRVALSETQVLNIITRDAVRGIYEWCLKHKLIDHASYEQMLPVYVSDPPQVPPTREQLEREYGRSDEHYGGTDTSYRSLLSSLFGLADFRRYVIEPTLRHFSRRPLVSCCPVLSPNDIYSVGSGARWVFERALSLGWTPENFAHFDQIQSRAGYRVAGRGGHKPERFGKKYQWIALRELIARVTDNFHMMNGNGRSSATYAGPWQFFGRDVDPTLPPPRRVRNENDEYHLTSTFVDAETWWRPPGPHYHHEDPAVGRDWAAETADIPEFPSLVRREDEKGARWVVLHAYYQWADRASEIEEASRPCRELWSHIYGWLVQAEDRSALVAFLDERPLMGRWMPEGRGHADAAYLGELPWAAAGHEYPETWEGVRVRGNQRKSIKVRPAWESYVWEGNSLDCSIDQDVRAFFPSPLLYGEASLTWIPGTRQWCAPDETAVARYFEDENHRVLVVREDWLNRTLQKLCCSIVIGWLGEKRLFAPRLASGLVGDMTAIHGIASLVGTRWEFGERRLKRISSLI